MRANIINYSQLAKWNPIFQPQASILALLSLKLKVSCSEYGCQNRVLIALSVCLSGLSHLLCLPFGLLRKPRCGSLLSRHAFRVSRIFSVCLSGPPGFLRKPRFCLGPSLLFLRQQRRASQQSIFLPKAVVCRKLFFSPPFGEGIMSLR